MIIILEGPDESGKSTLAAALIGYFEEVVGLTPSYFKSPAGQKVSWHDDYNNSVYMVARILSEASESTVQVAIMDRVAEVSEIIYSWALTRPSRCPRPLAFLPDWRVYNVVYINCMARPGEIISTEHRDPFGQHIQHNHLRISTGYDLLARIVSEYVPVFHWKWGYPFVSTDEFNSLLRFLESHTGMELPIPESQYLYYAGEGDKYVQHNRPDATGAPDLVGGELPPSDAMATDSGDAGRTR